MKAPENYFENHGVLETQNTPKKIDIQMFNLKKKEGSSKKKTRKL
jgi:hypothetical protein